MSFEDVLDRALEMLKRRGRVTYRALKRQFDLDDEALEDLKEGLLFTYAEIQDEENRGLAWKIEIKSNETSSSEPPESIPVVPNQTAESNDKETSAATFQLSSAERRQLTVMFCDLVGSTALSGQMDPEDLREVVRAYQNHAAGLIQQYEGHIAQYLGDGLLVYFGWPRAHEDDAHRAIHTGLSIVSTLDNLNMALQKAHGIELSVRIGIHSGPVVIGEMGNEHRHENLALGETPNIAARLEGLADPNTVIISDATRRLAASTFHYDELGSPDLKGVKEAVAIFRVHSLNTSASRFEARSSILSPLVGRDVEVQLLMRGWEQAIEGDGQVILLSGPPGIGKSRLLQALCSRLSETPHLRLHYQCSPYHTSSALSYVRN